MLKKPSESEAQFSFYTTRDAAKALGVSVTTIQLWVEAGVLTAWKTAGGHRRIPREAVDAMLAQQRSIEPAETVDRVTSVLVVEDDPVQRELYRIKFAEWQLPIKLHLAEDGFEGLVMTGKYMPNLILADLSMPGMDGFEMIRRLVRSKEVRAALLIVVTAMSEEEIRAQGGLPAGIPVYAKPIPMGVLKQIVERSLLMQAA